MKTRRKSRLLPVVIGLLLGLISPSSARADEPLPPLPGAAPKVPKAVDEVVYQGTIVPGARVEIGPEGPIPPGTSFRWTQVEGPSVAIDNPSASQIHFTAPAGAKKLAFLMSVKSGRGERSTRVMVPISQPKATTPAAPGVPKDLTGSLPIADAGDDQVGQVGRRITLDGTRSKPIGRVGYRWLQLSGPTATEVTEDGGYYSFVPAVPGGYRFALVVAHESRASVPDVVAVEVGQPERPGSTASAPRPAVAESSKLAQAVAAAVAVIPGGAETADKIADVFESVADRAPLFKTYGELQSEMTRRLDVVIPNEPTLRAAWSSQVLVPLSQITSGELMAIGIDSRLSPEAFRPLETSQKERVQAIFKGLAVAFRPRTAIP
jgi:hypothetical protein